MDIKIVLLIIGAMCIADSWAAVGRTTYYSEDNPGKCTVKSDLILNVNEKATNPEFCAEINCLDEKGHASISTCPLEVPAPNCKFGEPIDPKAKYPECCKKSISCVL